MWHYVVVCVSMWWYVVKSVTRKYQSINSSWDFDTVLDTINSNWFYPHEYFFPQSSGSKCYCSSLKQVFKKELQMEARQNFQAKKTSVTPKFCKQNFFSDEPCWRYEFIVVNWPNLWGTKNPGSGTLRAKIFIWEELVWIHSAYNTIKVPGGIIV